MAISSLKPQHFPLLFVVITLLAKPTTSAAITILHPSCHKDDGQSFRTLKPDCQELTDYVRQRYPNPNESITFSAVSSLGRKVPETIDIDDGTKRKNSCIMTLSIIESSCYFTRDQASWNDIADAAEEVIRHCKWEEFTIEGVGYGGSMRTGLKRRLSVGLGGRKPGEAVKPTTGLVGGGNMSLSLLGGVEMLRRESETESPCIQAF